MLLLQNHQRLRLDLEIYADIISVTQTDTDATAGVNARVMRLAPSTRFARYWTGETNPIQISVQRYSTDWELNIALPNDGSTQPSLVLEYLNGFQENIKAGTFLTSEASDSLQGIIEITAEITVPSNITTGQTVTVLGTQWRRVHLSDVGANWSITDALSIWRTQIYGINGPLNFNGDPNGGAIYRDGT